MAIVVVRVFPYVCLKSFFSFSLRLCYSLLYFMAGASCSQPHFLIRCSSFLFVVNLLRFTEVVLVDVASICMQPYFLSSSNVFINILKSFMRECGHYLHAFVFSKVIIPCFYGVCLLLCLLPSFCEMWSVSRVKLRGGFIFFSSFAYFRLLVVT